jgi:glycosyltransferase involved in cell wall biosynthesis
MMQSPGGVQLVEELIRSAHESAPEQCDVVALMRSDWRPWPGSEKLNIVSVAPPKGRWFGKRQWYDVLLPKLAKAQKADVLYSMSGIVSAEMCKSSGVVTTANNMMPFTQERLRTYPLTSRTRWRYAVLRHVLVASMKKADAIVLHSRHAQNMIEPHSGDLSSKLFVVLTGVPRDVKVDPATPPPHPYEKAPYFLYLSAIYAYKNHVKFIEAYRHALNEEASLPDLLIAGPKAEEHYFDEILAAIKQWGLESKVKYIGYLDRKDVPAWIYHADINFFPSLCETSSLVVVEILGSGGVLACSNVPPMPEVASYAAELFDPYSAETMKPAILKLWRDRRRKEELRSLAFARAAELSWNACGKVIWQAAAKAHAAFIARSKE